eukprot:1161299-Pelagomonas_calceolata.AAC.5
MQAALHGSSSKDQKSMLLVQGGIQCTGTARCLLFWGAMASPCTPNDDFARHGRPVLFWRLHRELVERLQHDNSKKVAASWSAEEQESSNFQEARSADALRNKQAGNPVQLLLLFPSLPPRFHLFRPGSKV